MSIAQTIKGFSKKHNVSVTFEYVEYEDAYKVTIHNNVTQKEWAHRMIAWEFEQYKGPQLEFILQKAENEFLTTNQ